MPSVLGGHGWTHGAVTMATLMDAEFPSSGFTKEREKKTLVHYSGCQYLFKHREYRLLNTVIIVFFHHNNDAVKTID